DGDDLVLAVIDLGGGGVEKSGLAAAGWPGDEQHSVRFVRKAAQGMDVRLAEAEAVERELLLGAFVERLLVEYAQHRVLAVNARHDRNAEIHGAAAIERLEAPVLRHAPLGDIEFRQHLYPGDRLLGLLHVLYHLDLGKDPVDAELDDEPGGNGLEVDVARADLQRVAQ